MHIFEKLSPTWTIYKMRPLVFNSLNKAQVSSSKELIFITFSSSTKAFVYTKLIKKVSVFSSFSYIFGFLVHFFRFGNVLLLQLRLDLGAAILVHELHETAELLIIARHPLVLLATVHKVAEADAGQRGIGQLGGHESLRRDQEAQQANCNCTRYGCQKSRSETRNLG